MKYHEYGSAHLTPIKLLHLICNPSEENDVFGTKQYWNQEQLGVVKVPIEVTEKFMFSDYLTIIPRARMGYESIAHEAEGRMGY